MLKLREVICGSLLVAGVMTSSACTTDDMARGDADGLITEVELANGATVSFYEPQPGTLGIGELAPKGVIAIPGGLSRAVDIYAAIAPGQPIPAELAAAQARADAANNVASAPATTGIDAPTGRFQSKITDISFENQFCYNENWQVIICPPEDTKIHIDTHSGVKNFHMVTCTNTGKVTASASVDTGLVYSRDMQEDQCFGWHWIGKSNLVTEQVIPRSSPVKYDRSFRYDLQ